MSKRRQFQLRGYEEWIDAHREEYDRKMAERNAELDRLKKAGVDYNDAWRRANKAYAPMPEVSFGGHGPVWEWYELPEEQRQDVWSAPSESHWRLSFHSAEEFSDFCLQHAPVAVYRSNRDDLEHVPYLVVLLDYWKPSSDTRTMAESIGPIGMMSLRMGGAE